MGLFDGLISPAAVGGAFTEGLERGRKTREEREVKGALAAYAINPGDPQAFQTLAQYKPELAIKIGEDRRKREQELQVQRLSAAAAQGDKGAIAQLAGVDLDAFIKLDSRSREVGKQRVGYIGEQALRISRLPPEMQPAAWDDAIQRGVEAGYSDLAAMQGKYSPDALNAAITNAGLVGKLFELTEPHYQAIPEGGTLVNTNDPGAVRSYMGGAGGPAPAQSRTIGGKTYYQAPDGKWHDEPVGGGVGNGAGSFQR